MIGPPAPPSSAAATLFFAHATVFCKEVWSACYGELDLLAAAPSSSSSRLPVTYDCLALDFTGHGDSRERVAHMSRPLMWQEFTTRDVLEVLGGEGPEGGEEGKASTTATTAAAGGEQQRRPVVGVGHSMGGAALVLAELANPGLFDRLILLEPILPPPDRREAAESSVESAESPLATRARRRRGEWGSVAEARAYFESKPLFQQFDRRALDGYINGGLAEGGEEEEEEVEEAGGKVRKAEKEKNKRCVLKCTPTVEAETYDGVGASVWDALHRIDCPVTLVVGGQSQHLDGWAHNVDGGCGGGRGGGGEAGTEEAETGTVGVYRAMAGRFRRGDPSGEAGAEVVVMEGHGHFASLEKGGAASFARLVDDAARRSIEDAAERGGRGTWRHARL